MKLRKIIFSDDISNQTSNSHISGNKRSPTITLSIQYYRKPVKKTGRHGEPDFIYVNTTDKLLILIENKDSINDHESKSVENPIKYAVDGIKWYISFFQRI